ncbi:MAG: tRNA (adenosine(37)-N6)-threonylcarbamoyltransferase complex ATPase subunit type 1 TsaE [Candidatus Magasanikbacteria bacterium]|nr:tRNA (adenosine(37)-N6)-threonylcarbamoyltransferase complex ATPase subunit type 1 TsaE [Candidatus Magasanikbacteria bacterium]
MEFITNSPTETEEVGKNLVKELKGGDIILLNGELGAGKSTFVKGIAQGLKIKRTINSPTFTLMNVYTLDKEKNGIKKLIHIDTYRLKDEEALIEIGAEDYIGKKDTLTLIEWPEKVQELIADKDIIEIDLIQAEENRRKIVIRGEE